MRTKTIARALIAQRQTLFDAKTMLFIDNDEPEPPVLHILLKQRVGPDRERRCLACKTRMEWLALAFAETTGQQHGLDTQRLKPAAQGGRMLFGQQFGRCHQGHLVTRFEHVRRDRRRHRGFAGANIALQQT